MIIVSINEALDKLILSIDQDRMVCAILNMITEKYDHEYELPFTNARDQNNEIICECGIFNKSGIILIDGLGDKNTIK